MSDTLRITGSGDAPGVPRVYCDCDVCTSARTGGVNRRTRCSALLRTEGGNAWLDCGPDWRAQMEVSGLRFVETFLLTHPHHDHIGGLPELYDACRWLGRRARVLATPATLDEVLARYRWVGRALDLVPIDDPVEVLGYRVRAWQVNHGHNGHSYAFRLERPGFVWAYCPDSIDLRDEEKLPLYGLDLLVLGTAHPREDAPRDKRSLYDMEEALDLLRELRPRRAVFTHLSHTVDARRDPGLPGHVTLAYDGLEIPLA